MMYGCVILCLLALGKADIFVLPPAQLQPAPYAPWAHSHMVWLDSQHSNQSSVLAYVEDYLAHNISVGGIDIDSEWATGNNNFIVDTTKFPDLGGLVNTMHGKGINVVLWMTSMIDTDSSNFQAANASSYLIRNGFNSTALLKWWHGLGGLLDYGNPDAKSWWENQLDNVLQLGIDGWKADGTDPYIIELLTPISAAGYITRDQYSAWYYGHTFNYTREKNGPHCLVWSRPVDSYPVVLNLSAFLEFSPQYEMASGWVGDQDPTFFGLKMALINILESAWRNYANFGSDTGGYRDGARTGELLLRWAQVNAFLPMFENGGDGEHRAWMYDEPGSTFFLNAYQKLVAAHYELGPYFLTIGTTAILGGTSVLTPQSKPPADFPFIVQPDMLDNYAFSVGPNIFVSPIVDANVTSALLMLPGNQSDVWVEYWNQNVTHHANVEFMYSCPLSTSAVFLRAGAILPLHVSTHLSLMPNGDRSFASAVSLLVHTPSSGVAQSVDLHDWENSGMVATYNCNRTSGTLSLRTTAFERDIVWVVRNIAISNDATVSAKGVNGRLQASSFARVPATPAYPASFTPPAVDWQSSSPSGSSGRPSYYSELRKVAAASDMTWSYAPADVSASGTSELIIRAGPGGLGVSIMVDHVQC